MSLKWTNLQLRVISGVVGIAITTLLFWWGSYGFLIWISIISLLGLKEFIQLFQRNGYPVSVYPALVCGVLSFVVGVASAVQIFSIKALIILPLLWVLGAISLLYDTSGQSVHRAAFILLTMVYVPLPMACYVAAVWVFGNFNLELALGLITMLWASDSGAYFVGKFFGRHKLFERISPKKTWEGFMGGMAAALLAALLWSQYTNFMAVHHWYVLGIIIVAVGTWGDLVESMFKRNMNIKDSGSFLPGHGGVLDRFDGLLMASPVVMAYLYWIV
jgi:phosphatidate cytidylyltransferase